nr:hypothetical protein [Streptomyces brevispora]
MDAVRVRIAVAYLNHLVVLLGDEFPADRAGQRRGQLRVGVRLEQIPWQTDRPHRQELVDLGEHRLQAHVARRFLDLRQHRRRVLALRTTALGSGVVLVGAGHQSRDPLDALHGQPGGDQGRQRLLGRPQGSRHDPIAPARRGRLDALLATAGQQFHPDLLGPAFLARDVLGQIRRQLLRVRDAALTEAEVLPDLRAVVLDRAARPVVGLQLRGRNPHLTGDELHGLTGRLCPVPGKPAVLRIELQQHGEAQSRRTALAGHEHLLVLQQRPVLDEFIQVQRSAGHDRRSSSQSFTHRSRTAPDSPTRATPRKITAVCGW